MLLVTATSAAAAAQHAGALVGQALVPAAVAQLLGAAEGVAVGGVLAELRPLQAVLLVEPDVVQRLAVAVGGRLGLPARRRLRGQRNRSNIGRRSRPKTSQTNC